MIINNKTQNLFISFSIIILILYLGKNLLIPFFFSVFLFIILKSLSSKISEKKIFNIIIPYNFSFLIITSLLFFIFYLFGILIENNLSVLIAASDEYQDNLLQIFSKIKESRLKSLPFSYTEFIDELNFTKIFTNILNLLTSLASNFSLIILYLIFFILEENFFKIKILKLFKKSSTRSIFEKIRKEIFGYFQIKTFTSLLTGILTFILLFLFDSDLAMLFGLLAFILNFIPFLGSLISILLPFLFSLVQFLDLFQPLMILIFSFFIQILIGNIVEPKLMGKSLNLSPLVMLLTLGLMGKLWGISGMFLSIPILVILLICFNNFESTKKIAILLSEKGEIN